MLALGHGREPKLETVEVYKRDKKCTHRGLRDFDEMEDELVELTPLRVVEDGGLGGRRRSGLLLLEGTLDRGNRR